MSTIAKRDFRDTPIGVIFEQMKHDLPLIQRDVEDEKFDEALRGINFQIGAFTKLHRDLSACMASRAAIKKSKAAE